MNGSGEITGLSGGSGGYAEFILVKAAEILFGIKNPEIHSKQRKNTDFVEKWIEVNTKNGFQFCSILTFFLKVDGEQKLCFALAYGFRNIQTIARMVKSRKGCPFQYVEIMACPGGKSHKYLFLLQLLMKCEYRM